MEALKAIMTLVAAMAKLPAWTDVAAVKVWLTTLVDPAAVVLNLILGKPKLLAFPPVDLDDDEKLELCEQLAGGNGKLLDFLKALLPIILQILPLFIKVQPPTPPAPPVV